MSKFLPEYKSESDSDENECETENTVAESPRQKIIWEKEAVFIEESRINEYISRENCWSKLTNYRDANGCKVVRYRCNKVRLRGEQCAAALRIVFNSQNEEMYLYRSQGEHNHESIRNNANSTKFSKQVKDEVKKLFDWDHYVKPAKILNHLLSAKLTPPSKYQLNNYLAQLRKEKFGPPSVHLEEIKVETNRCRICLTNQKDFLPIESKIDENDESSLKYYEIINLLMNTDCEVKKDDGKPQIICIECAKLTQYAYKLKRRCEQSEITLENELNQITIAAECDIKMEPEEIEEEIENALYENNLCDMDNERTKIEIEEHEIMKDDSEDESNSMDDLNQYKCSMCGFEAPTTNAVGWHMAKEHDDQKEFKCDICDKKFFKKQQLNKHKLRHEGVKRFKCDKCEASFLFSGELKKHALLHTGEKAFKCDVCDKCFTLRSTLSNHKRVHLENKRKVNDVHSLKCDVCGKCYLQKHNLVKHMNIHTQT